MIKIKSRFYSSFYTLLFVLGILIISACSSEEKDTLTDVLIEIKDKKITREEFIKRAEYTIRPSYCRGDGPIDKKIIFNSLVAEKLFALEAGEENELTRNEEFKTYMTGRMEQSMRQYFYHDKAYNKVNVSDAEVNEFYKNSDRRYQVGFLTLDSEKKALSFLQAMNKHDVPLDSFYLEITGLNKLPVREIGFFDPDIHPEIEKIVFGSSLKKGEKIGPIKTGKNEYVFLEIKGWKRTASLSTEKQRQDWLDVKEKIINSKASEIYSSEVLSLMSGKNVTFNRDNFTTLVNLLGPQYVKEKGEIKEQLKNNFWLNKQDREALNIIGEQLEKLSDRELLTFNGTAWTINDFEKELAKHPLVFRNPNFARNQFAEQLKLAIIDMIRDREITKASYQMGYHEKEVVKQNYSMWRDNLLAQFYKNQIITKMDNSKQSSLELFDSVLNPHVKLLQKKYSDDIVVDINLFNSINLTRTDMIALQKEMPFPIVVPSFPQITDLHQMDYGVIKN